MNAKKLSLAEYQKQHAELMTARGFDDETIAEKFMLLLEEAGEFAKAVRKVQGIKVATDAKQQNLSDEAADVFALLLDLCNNLKIDLAAAYEAKELKNSNRTWQ